PGSTVAHRSRRNVRQVVARMPLGLGKGKGQAAVDDLWNEGRTLLGIAAVTQKAAAEHYSREKRLERQGASERLHPDHHLARTAPRGAPAILSHNGQPDQP